MNKRTDTWYDAFKSSPGPNNLKEAFTLFLKGVCMGSADIIPGVSGGTIALITGIYQNLLEAIKSVNINFIKNLFTLKIKQAISIIHIRFLLSVLSGILIAILSLARFMNYSLHTWPTQTWSLFLGLIIASIIIVGKKIDSWIGYGGLSFLCGTLFGYIIVGMIPVATPQNLWFIFLCGMIAICAMILPGLSGAFLLLILGKYAFITGALKNPFNIESFIVIITFTSGCAVGIAGFSRFLSYLLAKYYNLTIAMLTGLMFGSVRKVWPWKEVLDDCIIRGKKYVLLERNILPNQFDDLFFISCSLIFIGFIFVLFMERIAHKNS